MEIKKFIHDSAALLYSCIGSDIHLSIGYLGPFPKAFLWTMRQQQNPVVFDMLLSEIYGVKEDIVQNMNSGMELSGVVRVGDAFPSILATPFVTFLMASWISDSFEVAKSAFMVRSEIFQSYWRMFRYWISKENWVLIREVLSRETRYHLAILIERFMRFTDPMLVDEHFSKTFVGSEMVSLGNHSNLLNLTAYSSFALAFCSVLQKSVDNSHGDFYRNIDMICANLLSSLVQCGPLPEKTKSKNGEVSLPETLHLHILICFLRGPHVYDVLQEALAYLLKWNPQLIEAFIRMAYFGWQVPDTLTLPSKWNIRRIKDMSTLVHLNALEKNFSWDPKRWSALLSIPRFMFLSLLHQVVFN